MQITPFLHTVVSGGQTGADRAGIEAGLAHGLVVAGFCPHGYRAEDGMIPDRYAAHLTPLASNNYAARTKKNIALADATLILVGVHVGQGSALTQRICVQRGQPCLLVNVVGNPTVADDVLAWLRSVGPATLNVAGSRESKLPGIQRLATLLLTRVFAEIGRPVTAAERATLPRIQGPQTQAVLAL